MDVATKEQTVQSMNNFKIITSKRSVRSSKETLKIPLNVSSGLQIKHNGIQRAFQSSKSGPSNDVRQKKCGVGYSPLCLFIRC